jgi:putative spermidine/putrescine transport system substrate-binding protein
MKRSAIALMHRFGLLALSSIRFVCIPALLICGLLCFGSSCSKPAQEQNLEAQSWDAIESIARGQTVRLMMWQGDPYINAYMKTYVVPEVQKRHGITLELLSAQGAGLVSQIATEIEAGVKESSMDLMWINGETFYQLRHIKALYGPFTGKLPNMRFVDTANPFISYDFQQPIAGYECPWGNVQMAIIYDSARTPNPPQSRLPLASWVREHPGRFTFDNSFTGMTLLKSWLIELAGGEAALHGAFKEDKYAQHSQQLWEFINGIKPYFWKQGRVYPSGVAEMHQLFASGEIDFTMSNNDGEVDNKVLQGLLPRSSRAFVLEGGTIQNSHYMGIAAHSAHKAAAMVVINVLISPEAQLKKFTPEVWGDGTVLAINHLPAEWQKKFANVPTRKYSPNRADIQAKALQELAPEYMIRLYADFRKNVIER